MKLLRSSEVTPTRQPLMGGLKSTGSSWAEKKKKSLAPSTEYPRMSLQRLIALEVLLFFKVRARVEKIHLDEAAKWLSGKLDFLVTLSMWDAVCLVSDSFDATQSPRKTQLSVKINGWIAHANRDGLDSIRGQISEWDTSGLEERYAVTKKILARTVEPRRVG